MKEPICASFICLVGVAVGIVVFVITKKKQQKAKETGHHIPYGVYEAVFKRPLDAILSLLALLVLSPVIAVTAVLVRMKLGSPVIFMQIRPGLNEKMFCIFKFRTMTDEKNDSGQLLPDGERLTSFGRLLRSTSLDELPELINILKGDMAIVGPRPLLVEYLPRYSSTQRHRHDVRPGLTGYAQVSGRNEISWDKKFEDDIRYMEKITFCGDLKIIMKTIEIVLKREGIHSKASVTADPFMGNGKQ